MSVSHRLYYQLLDNDLTDKFAKWICKEYPILFIQLVNQFRASAHSA